MSSEKNTTVLLHRSPIGAAGPNGPQDKPYSSYWAKGEHLFYRHNLSYHDLLSTACNKFWF